MQREIVEYAELSQSTMQSTKIITESLAYLSKVGMPPAWAGPQVEPLVEDNWKRGGPRKRVQGIGATR